MVISLTDAKEKALKIQEERPSSFDPNNLWKLQLEEGFPYNVAILSPYTLNVSMHFVKGQGAVLCDKVYDLECERCLEPGYQGKGINYPVLAKCLIGYVFDLKDKKDKNKKGEEFTHNPLKVIEIQAGGRSNKNWEKIEEAIDEEFLVYDQESPEPSVLRVKKNTPPDKGLALPYFLSSREIKKLKEMVPVEVDQAILDEWGTKPEGEIYGTILQAFGNLKKSLFSKDFVFPDKEEVKPDAKDEDDAGEGKDLDLN